LAVKRGDFSAWRSYFASLFGLPMTQDMLATYRACTNRVDPPTEQAKESWLVCGRRAGKSYATAILAVFLACFVDYSTVLSPGERGVCAIIAPDRSQAAVICDYVKGLLRLSPLLSDKVIRETANSVTLDNGIRIAVHTASFRKIRGHTLIACCLDELAMMRGSESAEPDHELIKAIRPALATTKGMLLCLSSPYGRSGALWEAYRDHFGKPGSKLVWQSPSKLMNGTIPDDVIEAAIALDPHAGRAEWYAEFRSDVARLYSHDLLEASVDQSRQDELPPRYGVQYHGFFDGSGGTSDSACLAIAHAEDDGTVVLDVVREVLPPFDAEQTIERFCQLLTEYGVPRCYGDRWGGTHTPQTFAKFGIEYVVTGTAADDTKLGSKADIMANALPLFTSGRVLLPNLPKLLAQLGSLERSLSKTGRESVGVRRGLHDDIANSCCGALLLASQPCGAIIEARNLGRDATRLKLSLSDDGPIISTHQDEQLIRDRFQSRHDEEFGIPGRLIA
jgi:hypothetical protein